MSPIITDTNKAAIYEVHKHSGKSFISDDPVTKYIAENSFRLHPVQEELINVTLQHTDNVMMGAPEVLQLISNLMFSINAKKYIDVGVFTGCSTLNAALALPEDGKVIALDINETFVNVGKPFFKKAGVDHKIEIRIAPALESLDKLIAEGQSGTFDFAFVDAHKVEYYQYYERLLQLIRKGGIIAVDNVLWGNSVLDKTNMLESTVAIREFNQKLKSDNRIKLSMLPIGDGLSLAFVL